MLNNKIMAKRGVSAVVATVLIVMITVAAVAIIWSTVIPMIRNTASEGLDCYDAESNIEILPGAYTCSNNTVSKVQVSRSPGSVEITNITVTWIKKGESNIESFPAPTVNGMKTYTTAAAASVDADEVRIAPTIKVGNVAKNCTATMPFTLPSCG